MNTHLVESHAATTAIMVGDVAFTSPEALTAELFLELSELCQKRNHDHELVVLLSPLYEMNDLGPEAATTLMKTMWKGLKERFLEGRSEYDEEEEISQADLHYIFEQLVLHLSEAIKELQGEV